MTRMHSFLNGSFSTPGILEKLIFNSGLAVTSREVPSQLLRGAAGEVGETEVGSGETRMGSSVTSSGDSGACSEVRAIRVGGETGDERLSAARRSTDARLGADNLWSRKPDLEAGSPSDNKKRC
jgi:hypothetical protein